MKPPIVNTIVFPVRDGKVLLALKKRGFGAGLWNGFGGKQLPNETLDECARRETLEESMLTIIHLQPVARLLFYFEDKLRIACLAYISKEFHGEPQETTEMGTPQWFPIDKLPLTNMWSGDDFWIPRVIGLSQDEPIQNFGIHFDADKNFLEAEILTDKQTKPYLSMTGHTTGATNG